MDEQTERLYAQYRQHLLEGRRLSFQQFDKAVLTLSGGGLGLSLTFIDRVVPLSTATHKWILALAWGLFAVSVMSTLISFITSQFAFDRELMLSEDYYMHDNEEALTQLNRPATLTKAINVISAASFLLAVMCLVYFVSINVL